VRLVFEEYGSIGHRRGGKWGKEKSGVQREGKNCRRVVEVPTRDSFVEVRRRKRSGKRRIRKIIACPRLAALAIFSFKLCHASM
jgi:hypothetical protein